MGSPSEYHYPVWRRKTRMAWLPDGEKNSKILIRFDATHKSDGQTDTQRHRQTLQLNGMTIVRENVFNKAEKRKKFFLDFVKREKRKKSKSNNM